MQSMSRSGNCLDNAAMESFFGTLKSEYFHLTEFDSVEQLREGLDDYIRYYDEDRIKLRLTHRRSTTRSPSNLPGSVQGKGGHHPHACRFGFEDGAAGRSRSSRYRAGHVHRTARTAARQFLRWPRSAAISLLRNCS